MHAPPRPSAAPLIPERRHTGIRLLASTCIASAWITLVVSVLMGFSFLAAPAPGPAGLPLPTRPDLDPGGLGGLGAGMPGAAGGMGALLPMLAGGLRWIGALTLIGGGVLGFFLLAALGQGLYLLLDLEENTRVTAGAMAQIARRMGG